MPKADLNASLYQRELATIGQAMSMHILREWPKSRVQEARGATVLFTTLEMALRYWNSMNYIAYGSENPVAGWYPEHSLVFPLIDRTLMEMTANVLFLLENLEVHGIWFLKAGWREAKIAFDAAYAEYWPGQQPEWLRYLNERGALLEKGRVDLAITLAEAGDPAKAIQAWPTIGHQKTYKVKAGTVLSRRRTILKYLWDRFYSELSSIAHSDGFAQLLQGALATGLALTYEQRSTLRENIYPYQRSKSLFLSSMFLLMIVCEVQQYLGYNEGLIQVRLLRVWEHLSIQGEVSDVFQLGYKDLYDLPSFGSRS